MAVEIERKFLIAKDTWRDATVKGVRYRQGYLAIAPGCVVRVRVAENLAFLTVKSSGDGLARQEFEYAVPLDDAHFMLERLCRRPLIDKHRYRINHHGCTWEIDEFHGDNEGLVVAEIELETKDQVFTKPSWVGREVTGDPRYYNASLAEKPFSSWKR